MKKKNELHPHCQQCLKQHAHDWYVKGGKVFCKDKGGAGDFQICGLIHEEMQVSETARKNLSEDEMSFANFLYNPTLWTATEIAWNARWYQDYMLKCTAMRKVSRIGRRAGKTEAICINMLHYAYTHEGVTVLVIAPYKNQVGLIFDKLDQFLGKSESLTASIKRNTKNPYRVEFHNGSKILGFTSGTRTGSKSTGIRGQDAHMILIDEADYLSESDFEVILAIQASRPDVLIWASSTPTGKREMFWRFCTDIRLGYKEFHFPSSVSPSWNSHTERLAKAEYSDAGYKHEFEAEFGDVAEGVFLKKFVDASLQEYDLSRVRRQHESLYTIGVDWNTAGNGTCIIVNEWNKALNGGRGAFKVVQKIVITQEEFTQVRSCEEIIRLNEKWDPAFIYVDTGYGATQIEMLRKYGLENPTSGLANKVKGIYFGDKMEIRDPVTKQIIKKHMKPFIVNLAARRMEDGQIILPESEDIKNGLVGQIRDYLVIRTTALGQPIYSDENDHAVVAWMLSILAATMEYSDIAKQGRTASVGIAGRFGEHLTRDFLTSKTKTDDERRQRAVITPRWFGKHTFSETTARNSIDFMRAREKKPEGKKTISTVGQLKRLRSQARREGRATF
jgi:replicative DNA helicase